MVGSPDPKKMSLAKLFEAHAQKWAALGTGYQCLLHNLEKSASSDLFK